MAKYRQQAQRQRQRAVRLYNGARAIHSAGKFAYNAYKAVRGSKESSGGGVTTQFDQKMMYRKRRVGKRRLRRSRKSFNRVRSNVMKMLGCNQFVFSTQTEPSSGANAQTHSSFMFMSAATAPSNDLTTIRSNIQTSGVAANFRKNELIYLKQAVCDITMFNQSATTADIDVYYIRCRKATDLGTSIQGVWSTYLTGQQKPDATLVTNLTTSIIGVTPWQAPQWCSNFTITGKRKYLLSQGQTAHFQVKMGSKYMNLSLFDEDFFYRGHTGVLIVWNGVNTSTASGFPDTKLSITYVRTYNVKYDSTGDDRAVTV